jgi:hypothetical protein
MVREEVTHSINMKIITDEAARTPQISEEKEIVVEKATPRRVSSDTSPRKVYR